MSLRIVPLSQGAEPLLVPDIVWDGVMGDFAPASADEVQNRGGLRARAQLATAVLICLMTDVRADPTELRDGDVNRGWPGDGFDLDTEQDERPMGSKLWLLRRRTVDEVETPRLAEDYAREALQVLVDQGAVAAVDVAVTPDPARNHLELAVTLTDVSGATSFAERYRVLWEQLKHGDDRPLSE